MSCGAVGGCTRGSWLSRCMLGGGLHTYRSAGSMKGVEEK